MKTPIRLLQAIFADAKRLEPDVEGLDRDLLTVQKRFEDEGYGFLTVTLPTIDSALLAGLKSGRFASPFGFKCAKGTVIPKFLSGLTSKIFDPSSGLLVDTPSIGAVKILREISNLYKKLQLDPKRVDELSMKEEKKFFTNDEICSRHHVDSHISERLVIAGRFVLRSLYDFTGHDLICRHGPGAVFEGVKGNQKWKLLYDHITSSDCDPSEIGADEFLYSVRGVVNPEQLELFPYSDHFNLEDSFLGSTARLVSVPKNSTSVRTITIEPLYKQYVQQGLNRSLREAITKCPILSNCLALSDQSKNQVLALEGSKHGNWATLDLKSASDLLSLELVRTIFSSKVRFLESLEKSRSERVVSSGDEATLSKYAGMGNATTFPVQSVCFSVIGIAAILEFQGLPWNTKNVVAASKCIRVYGDDIIVRTEYARQVVAWLELAGLKVNESKSFIEGNFRESCGMDAFMGYDVTPIYIRFLPDKVVTQPRSIAHLVAASNNSWLRALYSLSTVLKSLVESVLRTTLPIVTSESSGLGWVARQECFSPSRWNKALHRFEARTYALVTRKTRDRLDGWPALLKFFHLHREEEDSTRPLEIGKDHLSMSAVRFRNRIVRRWVPA